MKFSRFNTIVPHEDKYILHNSLENNFMCLDPALANILREYKEKNIPAAKIFEVHETFYEELVNPHILIGIYGNGEILVSERTVLEYMFRIK